MGLYIIMLIQVLRLPLFVMVICNIVLSGGLSFVRQLGSADVPLRPRTRKFSHMIDWIMCHVGPIPPELMESSSILVEVISKLIAHNG